MPQPLHRPHVRSPLLAAYRDWTDTTTPRVLRRRRAAVAGVLAVVAATALLVRVRLVPLPAAYALYWLHDYVALPFWGYAWSRFAPFSVIWWSFAALLTVVWLGTFLTRRSVVRGAHVRLCRAVVRRVVIASPRSDRAIAWLTAGVDWLAQRSLGAELLRDVVGLEHSEALAAVVVGGARDRDAARRLVRLTDLLTRLMSGVGSSLAGRWWALAAWHQTLMWIDRLSSEAAEPDARDALLRDLATTGTFLLARLDDGPDTRPAGDVRQPAAGGDGFAERLRQDLIETAGHARDGDAGYAAAIVASAAARLDELWAIAARGAEGDEGPAIVAKTVDGEAVEAFGVLTAGIGLHAAWLAADVHIAMDWLQAFEALTFVQHLTGAGRRFTARAPQPDQYRFARDMLEAYVPRLDSAPEAARAALAEAVALERIAIDGLADASGPDFDPARRSSAGSADAASRWRTAGRDVTSRLRHRLRHRPIPLGRRVDPILIGGAMAAAALYGLSAAALVLLFGSSEVGSWTARSLADRRILENVRRDLGARPFLDAVFHGPDRQLVISQAGGTFHSYDPATALWETSRPFGPQDLIHPDVRLLASSPASAAGPVLWGLTADGGLVRRQGGHWDVAVSDVRFVGSRGAPVQHADLTAIAVSADGRWLLAGAGAAGVGVQDLERRRWLAPEDIAAADRPPAVTHAAWWWDRFYVGGPDGVWELPVDRSPIAFHRVKSLAGSVVALESAPGQGLFVLQSAVCDNGPKDCMRLAMLAQPFAKPVMLIDERNRYPELSLDKTLYAEQWNDHLVLAGGNGIFDYDTRLRSWKRSGLEPVTTIAPCRSGSCFYFGYGGRIGGVGLFTPKTLAGEAAVRWPLPGEQPARVAASASGAIAVLAASGRGYALAPGKAPLPIHPATSSAIAPDRFRDAVAFGDKILFFGAPGALVHDVVRRDYRTLTAVPDWLRSPDAIVRASGSYLFGLERRGATYAAKVVPQQQVELGTLVLNTTAPLAFDGPIRAVDATTRDVLRVIDGHGRVLALGAGGISPLTGGPASDMAGVRPLDVAASADGLAVSTARGVRLYSSRSRSWTDALNAPPGETVAEIAQRNGGWLARSTADRLVTLGPVASTLIGGGERMPPGRPMDALASGRDVYLAWTGAVARYDTGSRAVTNIWRLDSNQPVRLRGVVGTEPLTISAGVARLGDRELARNVHSAFAAAGNLWLTKEGGGERYLETRPAAPSTPAASANNPGPSCLFRSPTAGPDVTELRDVRRLSSGLVAATTNKGLRLYSVDRRSWYSLGTDLPADAGQGTVHLLGSTLLVVDSTGTSETVRLVRPGVRLPESCTIGPAQFERRPEVLPLRSVAVDERSKRAFAVRGDGAVDEINETATTPWLVDSGEGPAAASIVHSWHFPDVAPTRLFVATTRDLWHYDLAHHVWSRIDVAIEGSGGPGGGQPIDLRPESDAIVVVATQASGEAYGGSLAVKEALPRSIVLTRLDGNGTRNDRRPPSPVFRIGAVTFFRDVRHGLLAVLETEDGRSLTAYRNGRFLWDTARRGVSLAPEGVLLLSDAGVHAATALSSFDQGPPGPVSPADRMDTGPDLVPRFYRAGRWYRRVIPGVWDPIVKASPDAVLVEDSETQWIRRDGAVTVESISGRRRIPILSRRHGLGLATDRLVDAAPYGGGFFLLTDGFVDLAELRPRTSLLTTSIRLPAPPGDALETLNIAGEESLWLTTASSASLWSAERQAFEPVAADANPYARRRLAESGPLRLDLVDGTVTAHLRVGDLQGNSSWAPIAIDGGRFPFDVVRSTAVVNGTLYVGTATGLQIYEGRDLGLESARHVALGAGNDPVASPVDRLGEPCDSPGTFVACGRQGCFERSAQTFAAIKTADPLACRLRAQSPLWSWRADATGVTGQYLVTPVPASATPGSAAAAFTSGPAITFGNGGFPHDDISQVVAFDSKLFTVWQRRQVGVHAAPSLRLTPEVRNHQFAEPVRLVAVADRIPMLQSPEQEIAPGLYALEGSRAWRFADSAWTRVDAPAEIATVVDYEANPPVLQRRRLRLVRRGPTNTLGFEMRMPGADWTTLPWDGSANRLAIDVWQNVAVDQGTLWIATPAGLVGRDGNWSFDPNAFRFVGAVTGEPGQAITDLRVEGHTAELRYDGDSGRVYRVELDERIHPARYAAVSGPDRFAEQPFSVDTRYWTWGLTGRVGTSAGRLAATWKGEPIGIANGRFDFDGVNSIALFQGLLHVATATRGWFVSPANSASLDRLARPEHPSIAPLDVTRLYDNHDPAQRELCLQEATGQFARLSPSGAARRTQGCPVLAATTDYWRYTRDAGVFRIVPSRASGRRGERRLVDGRFTDEVVIGAPVAGSRNGRPFTLVPTTAGVMWWDADGRTADMHAPPFQGKADVPRLLQWTPGSSPAYVADGTLYSLEVDDKPRAAWTAKLPQTAAFERLGEGPGPLLFVDWSKDGRRHHTVIDPRNNSVSHDDIPVDARALPAYFRRAMTDASHDGLIRLRLRDNVVRAYAGAEGWPLVAVDDSFQLLAGLARGTRAILIGPRHLIELNMDWIASAVYSSEAPPPPPDPGRR